VGNEADEVKYKVVLDDDGLLRSCSAGWPLFEQIRHYSRIYTRGWWTRADSGAILAGYGLLVFDTLIAAIVFCTKEDKTKKFCIYECEVEGRMPLPNRGIEDFLEALRNPEKPKHYWNPWPKDTSMWEQVKLLRPVSAKEIADELEHGTSLTKSEREELEGYLGFRPKTISLVFPEETRELLRLLREQREREGSRAVQSVLG